MKIGFQVGRSFRDVLGALGCVFLTVLALAADASAAQFTAQLRMARDGAPIKGVQQVEFALFDAATAGTSLSVWAADPIAFEQGLVTLGFSVDPAQLQGQARWVEVRIREPVSNAWVALSPRIGLTNVPITIAAQRPMPGAVGQAALDLDQVQGRIAEQCPANQPRMRAVAPVDDVTCDIDRGIDGIGPGLGIDLATSGTIGLNFGQVQLRRESPCPQGTSIRQIPIVGTPICVPDAHPLRGLTRVTSTCTFPGTDGVQTGCAVTPRCPAAAPIAIGGGQFSSCPPVTVNASYPVNDTQGQGWVTWMLKDASFSCASTVTVTAYAVCVAGP